MNYVLFLLLIVAGLVAMSGMIAAKRPDARVILDKLVPFQALIGIALLVVAFVVFLMVGPITLFKGLKGGHIFQSMLALIQIFTGIVLGFVLGIPMLAKLGGNGAKAQELAAKLAPYSILLGMVAAVAGAAGLLYALGIMQKIPGM